MSLLIPIHNDNDVEQAGNNSGIASGCCVVMVFEGVLARRLGGFAEDRFLTSAGRV